MSSQANKAVYQVIGGLTGIACAIAVAILGAPQDSGRFQEIRPAVELASTAPSDATELVFPEFEQPREARQQTRIARFIATEWDVGLDYAKTVVRAAFKSAERYQLDPIMLLAIAGKESSFRHIGNNPYNTYGIMQVIGRYHKDKFEGGKVVATDVTENIDLGAKVVREYLDIENGDEKRALMRYNGSEHKESYSRAVTALKRKLLRAVQRPEEANEDTPAVS